MRNPPIGSVPLDRWGGAMTTRVRDPTARTAVFLLAHPAP